MLLWCVIDNVLYPLTLVNMSMVHWKIPCVYINKHINLMWFYFNTLVIHYCTYRVVLVQDGKRLGRGKGYYDSYLKQIKDKGLTTKTIGELSYVRACIHNVCNMRCSFTRQNLLSGLCACSWSIVFVCVQLLPSWARCARTSPPLNWTCRWTWFCIPILHRNGYGHFVHTQINSLYVVQVRSGFIIQYIVRLYMCSSVSVEQQCTAELMHAHLSICLANEVCGWLCYWWRTLNVLLYQCRL